MGTEKKNHKVQWRGGFSDRNGINKVSTEIQVKEFDERTRTAFGNFFLKLIKGEFYIDNFGEFFTEDICEEFFKCLISDVYCESLVDFYYLPQYKEEKYKEYLAPIITKGSYAEILTLLEFLADFSSRYDVDQFGYRQMYGVNIKRSIVQEINRIFEYEFVGYKFVGDIITPITDETEVKEIETGLSVEFGGCRSHIQKALAFLSDRENPDYKNSIKESISAVESICKIITGDSKSDLSKTLKKLKDTGIHIHPTLEQAWGKLYAYTCDEGGVRHAEKAFESNVTFEEAKYMLVSCCAFVNYLIAEYGKIK